MFCAVSLSKVYYGPFFFVKQNVTTSSVPRFSVVYLVMPQSQEDTVGFILQAGAPRRLYAMHVMKTSMSTLMLNFVVTALGVLLEMTILSSVLASTPCDFSYGVTLKIYFCAPFAMWFSTSARKSQWLLLIMMCWKWVAGLAFKINAFCVTRGAPVRCIQKLQSFLLSYMLQLLRF